MADLTAFQEECEVRLARALSDLGAGLMNRVEAGGTETYVMAEVLRTPLQVYIYLNEAGIQAPGQWIPFESADFDTPGQLISAFVARTLELTRLSSDAGA